MRNLIEKPFSNDLEISKSIFLKCFLFLLTIVFIKSLITTFWDFSFMLDLENSKNSSSIASIELTSSNISSISVLFFSNVSDSFNRVRGVLKSWLTPESI